MLTNNIVSFEQLSPELLDNHMGCVKEISAQKTDSDHPVQAQSIIWAFSLHSYILYYPMIASRQGWPFWTAWMPRPIWAFAVHVCPKTLFPMVRPT